MKPLRTPESWQAGKMASRKMTFMIPNDLATQFLKRVPARERSHYVADALAGKLASRERELMRACEIANGNSEVIAIERELDDLRDEISEPWDHAATR